MSRRTTASTGTAKRPACFRHARLDDEILIIETHDGVDTTMLQEMTAVSDLPFSCGPAVVVLSP